MYRDTKGPNLKSKSREPLFPVRVIEVITDKDHPLYESLRLRESDIGSILYRPVDDSAGDQTDEGDLVYTGKAYPLSPNLTTHPLKNEIVLIVKGPRRNLRDSGKDGVDYYLSVLNILQHPHVNAYPVFDEPGADVNIGEGIELRDEVAPIQPYPGDTIVEGRLGQSIRLSGGMSNFNPYTDSSNKNKPFTFISNGVTIPEGGNAFTHIVEDINKDASSIFLTSDHTVPLNLANSKRRSYDDAPDSPTKYKGSQILLNAGRLVFNAKNDDILLSGLNSVGINSKTVNVDGTDMVCLDAEKIYLGSRARSNSNIAKQPVMLGHEVERFLQDLIGALEQAFEPMTGASNGGGPVSQTIAGAQLGKVLLGALKNRINPTGTSNLKSTKTYVE